MPAKAPLYPTERKLRPDESLRSINGSPIANPFLADPTQQPLARTKSSINIRRDLSFTHPTSRPGSQASNSSGDRHRPRNDSTDTLVESGSLPSAQSVSSEDLAKKSSLPFNSLTRAYSVTIATTDGHVLEFDPLQTSPRALDALEGISDSAKREAKKEIGRLVQAAVDKWKIA
jgi:hypothetical protein